VPGNPSTVPGPTGSPAWTLTTSGFTVPPIGSTAVVNVNDTTWAVVGEYVWVATAGGNASTPMALQIQSKTSTSLTLLNPPIGSMAPSGDANNLLTLGSDSLLYLPPSAIQPTIWSARLRSFNAIGNPNGEVSQRNVGNALSNPANLTFVEDRWAANTNLTGTNYVRITPTVPVLLPGTNFPISNGLLRFTVTTQKSTLAAGDLAGWMQTVEGSSFRELSTDVHSMSILVRSSVSPVRFGVWVGTPTPSYALTKLCTYTASPLTFQLIQLPNLPIWPAGGTFPVTPGSAGYRLGICFAAGSTLTSPANDIWQSGGSNFLGAAGQDNFMANAVNSYIEIAFIQHEPGPVCSTLIDKPFSANLDECLRYYQKTYSYGGKPSAVDSTGVIVLQTQANTNPLGPVRFHKPMAKGPTITAYSDGTGASGVVRDLYASGDRAVTGVFNPNDSGFGGFALSTNNASQTLYTFHYTADTGW
jgi:hypothetical protein